MVTKVLFYTHGLVDGGGERLWSCLASAMEARGYDVIFAQDFEAPENRSNLSSTIPLTTLGRNHIRSVFRLAALLKRERPHVALSAIGGSNVKLMLARWLSRAPVRTIITYHGFSEWKSGLLSFINYFALPLLSSSADSTVAVSDGLRERLIRRWGARPDKIVTLLNPVFFPTSAPVPSERELAVRPKTILSVGRLVWEKDFPTLLRAFARVRDPAARLTILGKGPDEAKLRQLTVRLGIAERVNFAGYSREPWAHYAGARCFALSSVSEPFGNVIVEALAFGLPVVATACSGPQEILKHGEYGRIVAPANPLQLAHAIEGALNATGDPAARRARAEEFSFPARLPAYEALIAKVTDTAGAVSQNFSEISEAHPPIKRYS